MSKFLSVEGDASVEIAQPGGRITVAVPAEVTPTPPSGSDIYVYKSTFDSTPLPGDGSSTFAFQVSHTCSTSKRLIEVTVQGAADWTPAGGPGNGEGSFDALGVVGLSGVPCVYSCFWAVTDVGTADQADGSVFTATFWGIVDATPDEAEDVGMVFQWSAPNGKDAANWIWSGFMRVSDYLGEVAP